MARIDCTVAINQLRTKKELGDRKLELEWLDFINQGPKFWGFIALSCSGMNSEFIKPQNLDFFWMKSRQSNFDLRSPSSFLVRS